ncbi:hypothetical protein C5167_021237 [Papaver somniferum]|uniref:Uncharacterized protein n=1 Tax=Papaver somniferum TaxID=3469 RepID=A0A4Y7IZ88_PAPSO|nr:hypothetical protein C5167_021237 [Papaver somniferum]
MAQLVCHANWYVKQVLRKLVDDASKFLNELVRCENGDVDESWFQLSVVLEVGNGVFGVVTTSGDTHLVGADFDRVALRETMALHLTETAEKAEMELTSLTEANISLCFITAVADGPKHIDTSRTRANFEELKVPVENSLRDAKLSFKYLDEVILVGGSTRIPAVQEHVKSSTGKDPNVTVNPDEVIALGAADQNVSNIFVLDVSPLSLGLETLGGVMTIIIPSNTTLLTSNSEVFSTAADGQTSVEINIKVNFDIDANGILAVAAIGKGTGKKPEITITGASTLPGDEVLRKLVDDASKFLNDKVTKAVVYKGNNETVLVFDLGGGTFDVSVLKVGNGVFEVLSTSADTHLGGNDFVKIIVDWLASFQRGEEIDLLKDKQALQCLTMTAEKAKMELSSLTQGSQANISFKRDVGVALLKDTQSLQRLTETAEKTKMELSSLTQANISLPFITATADDPKHIATLTRASFEELCSDLLDPVDPNVTVNPDEVAAHGAAIQVSFSLFLKAYRNGLLSGDVSNLVLPDVSGLSLGLETLGATDGQTIVEIDVLQVEKEFVRDNESPGSFCLDGSHPAPRGVPQI